MALRFGWVFVISGLFACSLGAADGPLIGTRAGLGAPGYSGDGGPSKFARLNAPFHVEHRNGTVLIAEALNHCIRRIAPDSTIYTIAGTGRPGYSGDGGPASKATFNEPYAVVADHGGTMFVVDRLNAAIRRIDAETGVITTIAGTGRKAYGGDGGPGVKAHLVEPNDCCLDGKGGLLIADVGDWRIRRLDLRTGIITTFAGVGRKPGRIDRKQIGDNGPANKAVVVGARAVTVDHLGNTYICEREGNAVRRVDAQGIISTIAGTGARGFSGDRGDARQATFNGPKGIRCDAAGNIYLVDAENDAIRRIDAYTNVVTTIAGGRRSPAGDGGPAIHAGLAQPHGLVMLGLQAMLIADTNNHRIREVQPLAFAEPPGPGPLPLILYEDFESGSGRWRPTDANAWQISETPRGKVFSQFRQSQYSPPFRSPFNIALCDSVVVGDMVLDARLQSTTRDYGHRDMCMVFGYRDPAHFYYVHLGKQADSHANQIFIVNGAARTKISKRTTPGTIWTKGWHTVRIVRTVADGRIDVYFDRFDQPAMSATDNTFAAGKVGIGSFDDTGNWDDIRLFGVKDSSGK